MNQPPDVNQFVKVVNKAAAVGQPWGIKIGDVLVSEGLTERLAQEKAMRLRMVIGDWVMDVVKHSMTERSTPSDPEIPF